MDSRSLPGIDTDPTLGADSHARAYASSNVFAALARASRAAARSSGTRPHPRAHASATVSDVSRARMGTGAAAAGGGERGARERGEDVGRRVRAGVRIGAERWVGGDARE
jgi:hypothetical protein